MRIADERVKKGWLNAERKELVTLIKSGTFSLEDPGPDERVYPIMEVNRAKIDSEGMLEKLKTRLVVRGDIMRKHITEDSWSPTAAIRDLKFFLADAARSKAVIWQLDLKFILANAARSKHQFGNLISLELISKPSAREEFLSK